MSPAGHWDSDAFDNECRLNRCSGHGGPSADVGLTGMALLNFLGAGETHRNGDYSMNVAKGLRWLSRRQDPEGCYADEYELWRTAVESLHKNAKQSIKASRASKNAVQKRLARQRGKVVRRFPAERRNVRVPADQRRIEYRRREDVVDDLR